MSESTATAPRRGRPPASSCAQIEAVALGLFLERGFTGTTLAAITAAAKVSKTSFFRYFPSKGDIVWSAFEEYNQSLIARLEAVREDDRRTMDLVRGCVVGSLESAVDPQGLWMRRFEVLEGSAELRAEQTQKWSSWTAAVCGFVAARHGLAVGDVVAQSVGGALHCGYLAVLRSWVGRPGSIDRPAAELAAELDDRLLGLTDALQGWLDSLGPGALERPDGSRTAGPPTSG